MRKEYSLIDILKILGKWKKHILVATLATAVVATVVSFAMPNYYKSSTTFYAMNPDLISPTPLRGEDRMAQIFGSDDDVDRLFSVANSTEIKSFLIDSFDLYTHYDINPNRSKGKKLMYQRLNKLMSTTKTRYGALELSIEDPDPEKAQRMVRAARNKIDQITQGIIKSSLLNLIEGKRAGITRQKDALKQQSDSLNTLRGTYNIVDARSQGEILSELLVNTEAKLEQEKVRLDILRRDDSVEPDSIKKFIALVAGLEKKKRSLDSRVTLFNEGYLPTTELQQIQSRTSLELSQDIERLSKLENSYNTEFKSINVVERENLPFEKSRPVRSLIILGFTVLAFILMSLVAIFIESTRAINWKDVYAGSN